MILDNETRNVHDWIEKHTKEGKINIVTGYFTIGALTWLARVANQKIKHFNFVLGEIVNQDSMRDRSINLLNENISLESAFQLHAIARQAVAFLEKKEVITKTLEPNFCHAKTFIFESENDQDDHYFIQGSSNLTEAGIGLRKTSNIELNLAHRGKSGNFKELDEWFEKIWNSPRAHTQKTIRDASGKTRKVDFKKYLIEQISKIFEAYTPENIYFKILFELFSQDVLPDQLDQNFQKQIGRLENTAIFKVLFEFQQKGVLSLIGMLKKHDGAVLADAVGLGKTWSALAVIKFFEMNGRETVLLCPKKLQHNWRQYQKNQNSKFETDKFEYFIRFHTDLQDTRFEKYTDRSDHYFQNDKPLLLVIDESHNLRNHKSGRYKYLINEILKHKADVKVLLISATPINNSLADIRNQYKLLVKGRNDGFSESLGIKNLDYSFRLAEKVFKNWSLSPAPKVADFIKNLPPNFFRLTDALTVARTRPMIEGMQNGLHFPKKKRPKNLFVTPKDMGNFETFEELFDGFPPMLSAYQPSFYVDDQFDSVLDDEKQRDRFLVKMMNILMVKRLESSWKSFFLTVEKIRAHHQNALDTIKNYQVAKKNAVVEGAQFSFFEEEEDDFADFIIGKKRQIKIADIDKNGKTEAFKKDLKEDLTALDHLSANLQKFQKQLENEHGETSRDSKLDALLKEINLKRASGDNQQNPKVLIFTVYRDTAEYLFSEMKKRGLTRVAMVSGDVSFVMGSEEKHQNFEPILQRFAPFTKLFKEKEWPKFEPKPEDSAPIQFADWQKWVRQHDAKTAKLLDAPVDILIATDALSEGQNLQDCDFVVNYDIHWNPVRVIQRFGRIDRLGSPNDSIACINFWPTDNINNYLNLQKRIEKRMTLMRLAGAEVPALFSKSFAEMNEGDLLETLQKERMMRQMQVSLDDIEVSEQQFGFDNLSLEKFRQDLNLELKKSDEFYQNMPRGVFSGFIRNPEILPADGLIALLGFPSKKKGNDDSRYPKYEIVFVDFDGKSILINQKEILEQLSQEIKQNPPRELPDGLETADSKVIEKLTGALAKWVKKQAVEEDIQADGSVKDVIGQSIKNKLARLKSGDSKVVEEIKQTDPAENEYQPENCDLIAWLVVHSEAIL